MAKCEAFAQKQDVIMEVLESLDENIFAPATDTAHQRITKAMKFCINYHKVVAAISLTSNLTKLCLPVITYLFFNASFRLPICSYEFFSEHCLETYGWFLYFYQAFGINIHMWFNVNIDTFILALMVLAIAQLDILDTDLRNLQSNDISKTSRKSKCNEAYTIQNSKKCNSTKYADKTSKIFKKCIEHYQSIENYCQSIEGLFSGALFIQFILSAIIICVCIFRLTLGCTPSYYVFLTTYLTIVLLQILVPCWFGTEIIYKSENLAYAAYAGWPGGADATNAAALRLFVERARRPLCVTAASVAGVFTLSLNTFMSIINSAYSLYTLLRHVQDEN